MSLESATLAHCFEVLGDVDGRQRMHHAMLDHFPKDAAAYR